MLAGAASHGRQPGVVEAEAAQGGGAARIRVSWVTPGEQFPSVIGAEHFYSVKSSMPMPSADAIRKAEAVVKARHRSEYGSSEARVARAKGEETIPVTVERLNSEVATRESNRKDVWVELHEDLQDRYARLAARKRSAVA